MHYNRKIYWINDTYSDDEILKADMDGVNLNISSIYSFTTDGNTLWGLAIDVPNNRLWVTRNGSNCLNSSIVRMTLSGSSYTEIDGNICNPHDIEYYNNNIYFLMDDGLIKAEPDGTSQVSISASVSAGNGIYLAIDGLNNKAYWTLSNAVDRIDLGGTGETTIFSGVSSLMGIDTDYNNPAALPVELTSFTANLINNTIVLNWQTATEVNNYGFEIERASFQKDGTTPVRTGLEDGPMLVMTEWKTIGFVVGHGNSNSPNDYSFTDLDILVAERSLRMDAYGRSYRLKQIDTDGSFEYSDIIEVEMDLPSQFNLAQNYPNPFNPSTVIKYTIPVETRRGMLPHVTLKVYDILGREVATLVNEEQSGGSYEVTFNASAKSIHSEISSAVGGLTSGIYFYKITSGEFIDSKKMILLK
ncbi:MAG: T9SS type A sorting domain-containing protein [Melioribacteraceae bacterium]|nr:T9SS type A sorting domain-containing protein [Melioribacteraceae bacterium]